MHRHLLGIGGVGMSALALALRKGGDQVSGSDRNLSSPNVRLLESQGIRVFPDDGSGVVAGVDELIVSTAIEVGNPGLGRALTLGIPVTHRAQALARTLGGHRLIAVVGTCGKSTVTAMLGHVLAECGLDPFCVNGANVPGWEGAVRPGFGELAVAEVDESDKSLVAFHPYAAIVTNASADHYSKAEMDAVFDAFVRDVPGPVIDGRRLAGEAEVSLPGRHNRSNAFLALQMALALGCDASRARTALLTFRGVERRLQRYDGAVGLPPVYDDYAHNPEKLRAMCVTLQEHHPGGLAVIWRPHGYGPLRKMLAALAAMFRTTLRPGCDHLVLLPVYDAGGTADRSISSHALAVRLPPELVSEVPDLEAAYRWGVAHRGEFAALVTAGARDPELPALARRLAESGR